MSPLQFEVRRGLRVSAVAQSVAQLIQFPTSLVLARLLTPAEFGTMGQVAVFAGVAYLFADLGLGNAIIQRVSVDHDELSTLFWLNLVFGLVLALVFLAGAPLIGALYEDSDLIPLTAATGTTFVFSSLKVTQYNVLRRRMKFAEMAWVDASGHLAASATAIGLALGGCGVWSLVGMRVARPLAANVALMFFVRFRPSRVFCWSKVRDMVRFGGYLLGTNTTNYASRNADKFLVGKLFGDGALGVYLRAYEFMMFPLEQISATVGRVMTPSMARQRSQVVVVRELLLSGLNRVAFLSAPSLVAVAVAADPLILTLFGQQWSASAPLLRVLALGGYLQSVGVGVQWVHVAIGEGRRLFLIQVWMSAILFGAAALGGFWGGLLGVAYGLVSAQLVLFFPVYSLTLRRLNTSLLELVRALAPASIAGLLSGVVARSVALWAEGQLPWLQTFFIGASVAAIYFPTHRLLAAASAVSIVSRNRVTTPNASANGSL